MDTIRDPLPPPLVQALFAPAALVAVAEIGDKTQLLSFVLLARFDSLVQVVIGTTLGMTIANAPAVWLADKLAERTPMRAYRGGGPVHRVGILTLFGFAP